MPKSLIPGHIRRYTDRGDCNNAIKYQINAMHRHVQKSIFVTSRIEKSYIAWKILVELSLQRWGGGISEHLLLFMQRLLLSLP